MPPEEEAGHTHLPGWRGCSRAARVWAASNPAADIVLRATRIDRAQRTRPSSLPAAERLRAALPARTNDVMKKSH